MFISKYYKCVLLEIRTLLIVAETDNFLYEFVSFEIKKSQATQNNIQN